MGDTLITIVAIFLAATLMFIFPLSAISEMNDKESLAILQSYTTEFVDTVRAKGKITAQDYDAFIKKVNGVGGNTYDVEIEVQHGDTNIGKKTSSQLAGDVTFYSEFTTQIVQTIESSPKGQYEMKEGDFIVVYVKNNNTTISQMIKGALYSVTGDQSYVIFAQASGTVISNGF